MGREFSVRIGKHESHSRELDSGAKTSITSRKSHLLQNTTMSVGVLLKKRRQK